MSTMCIEKATVPLFLMKLFVQVRVVGGGQIQDNIFSSYSFHVFFLLLECHVPLIVVILLFSSCIQLKHCLLDVNLSTDFNWIFELHFEMLLMEFMLISFYLICRLLRLFKVYLLTCLGSSDLLMSSYSIFLEHIPNQPLQLQCTSS